VIHPTDYSFYVNKGNRRQSQTEEQVTIYRNARKWLVTNLVVGE